MTSELRAGVLSLAVIGGCTGVEPPPKPIAEEPASAGPQAIAETPAPPEPVKPAEPEAPPISLEFSPVLEGPCPRLGASIVDGHPFYFYGTTIVHAPAGADPEDMSIDPTKFTDEPSWLWNGTAAAIEGSWPDGLWARVLLVDGRMWEGYRYLRRKDGQWMPIEKRGEGEKRYGVEQLYPWMDGQLLGKMDCQDWDNCPDGGLTLQVVRGAGKAPKFPELRAPREADCWTAYEMTALPSGEIFAAGRFCGPKIAEDAWTAVRWTPAGGAVIDRLTVRKGERLVPGPVVAASPTRAFAGAMFEKGRAATTLVAGFDGAAWSLLPAVDGKLAALDVDAEGRPWLVAGGRLVRGTGAGAWESLGFPTGPVEQVGGLREPVAWVVQEDGALWLRRAGEEFAPARLPRPAFSDTASYRVEQVRTGGREVWLTARYDEQAPGWPKKEPRRALLRNAPVAQTQRCETESYAMRLVTWPQAAREGCATPYAVLVRASSWTPKDFAYPGLGKALKGRQEFAAARFSEVEIGGRRIAGAAAPDLATARALAELVAGKIKDTRPEVVCAAPKELRPLPFDLATGKLAP